MASPLEWLFRGWGGFFKIVSRPMRIRIVFRVSLMASMTFHPPGAAPGTVNAAPPPNHPEKSRTSLLTQEKIHKETSEDSHKNLNFTSDLHHIHTEDLQYISLLFIACENVKSRGLHESPSHDS